jgi:hypothetical protein
MIFTSQEIKRRYFNKVYAMAPITKCACGCGKKMTSKDRYARDVRFINGHNGRKYKDPTQYKREWNHRNREFRQAWKEAYYKRRKAELIKIMGNKCENCGLVYNGENGCVFQFHHRNPHEREVRLNLPKMGTAWAKILEESKKCKLVCANCHFLIHGGRY